jgi:hypothetical protein
MALGRRVAPGTASSVALGTLVLGCLFEQEGPVGGMGGTTSSTAGAGPTHGISGAGSGGAVGISGAGTGGAAGIGGASVQVPVVSQGGTPAINVAELPPAPIGTPPGFGGAGGMASPAKSALFADQVVWNMAPAQRVLYSWTTAEQIAELRRDRVLLTHTETAGLGRGYAFTSIDALAARGSSSSHKLLGRLSQELFLKARFAWPHPWAARMGSSSWSMASE